MNKISKFKRGNVQLSDCYIAGQPRVADTVFILLYIQLHCHGSLIINNKVYDVNDYCYIKWYRIKRISFLYIKVLLIIYDGLKEDVATGPFYYISINVFI